MSPKINQYIKILFKNNNQAEGFVHSWEKDNYVIKSLDGKSLLIILNPYEDIIAIKVMLDQKENVQEQTVQKVQEEKPKTIINNIPEQKEIQEDLQPLTSNDLKLKKLAELRISLAKQEREIISNKLKSHNIEGMKEVKYGIPTSFKKPSSK